MWKNVASFKALNVTFPFYKKLVETGLFKNIKIHETPLDTENVVGHLFKRGTKTLHYIGEDLMKDYWQPTDETERRGTGDCEDMAIWHCRRSFEAGIDDIKFVVGKLKVGLLWRKKWLGHAWAEHHGILYDLANFKTIKQTDEMYGKSFRPFYAFDRDTAYRWDDVRT